MTPGNATILDPEADTDRRLLAELRADPRIEVIDRVSDQAAALAKLVPRPDAEMAAESHRWAYYPWRRTLVSILGPKAYRRLRLDRNRNLITVAEQDTLGALRIGVVGLSVGHAVAYALAAQGLCGTLRLADFDELELSNLNRVAATVFDLGLNKAVVAARRVAELDPYLTVEVTTSGLTRENVDTFLDGLDIVVEECDSLDMKALVREAARHRRLPVLMATTDRGLVDVERFDAEPDRPIFHGVLPGVDSAQLAELSNQQKIPFVLRMIDASSLSASGAASLIEVGHTLSTWPQLAGDVELGATAIAEAVRRIGLAQPLPSGRVRVDVAAALEALHDPLADGTDGRARPETGTDPQPEPAATIPDTVAAAAARAPSGGNVQPWRIDVTFGAVVVRLAPEFTSTMDVGYRASAVAIGAAAFNARVAAAAHRVGARVDFAEGGDPPLRATIALGGGDDADLAGLYQAMLNRETNRHLGTPRPIGSATVAALHSAARREGADLRLLTTAADLDQAAAIFAASDRIRYLTPHLHADMTSELRWPGSGPMDWGLDVRSLELDPGQMLLLDILRRPEVMGKLAEWDGGAALGSDARARVSSSAGLAVVTVSGRTLVDYARGGSAVEAVWIAAQQHGLAVQPLSPVFLYAHSDTELHALSADFAPTLRKLRGQFRELTRTRTDESLILPLRLTYAPPPSVRSGRRNLATSGGALP